MTAAPAGPIEAGSDPAATPRRDVPVLVFRLVTVVVVGLLLAGPGGIPDLLEAIGIAPAHDHAFSVLHRWHVVDVVGYITLLLVGLLVIAAWRPRRAAVVVQALLASVMVMALISLARPDPTEVLVPATIVVVSIIAAFPQRRALLQVAQLGIRSRVAAVAASVVTPFLVVNLWDNLSLQIGGTDPHALLGHWAGAAGLAFALLVAGWVAATTAPGARAVAAVVAATLLYLAVFALALGRYDGVWPAWGAVCAIVAAAGFLTSLRAEAGSR